MICYGIFESRFHISAELNASPIFKDGRIVGVQGIVRDGTRGECCVA
jgi:hypothetical protein